MSNQHRIGRALMIGLMMLFAVLCKAMPYLFYRWNWQIDPTELGSYIWNFSPLLPLAIVAGSSLSLRYAAIITIGTWFAGDLAIWAASGRADWAFYPHQPLLFCLILGLIGLSAAVQKAHPTRGRLDRIVQTTGTGLVGATLFFLLSNFGVWAIGNEMLYAQTWGGLMECYTNAIPFYRQSLISMALFCPALVMLFSKTASETVNESDCAAEKAISAV